MKAIDIKKRSKKISHRNKKTSKSVYTKNDNTLFSFIFLTIVTVGLLSLIKLPQTSQSTTSTTAHPTTSSGAVVASNTVTVYTSNNDPKRLHELRSTLQLKGYDTTIVYKEIVDQNIIYYPQTKLSTATEIGQQLNQEFTYKESVATSATGIIIYIVK